MADNVSSLKEQLVGLQKKYVEIEDVNRNLNERLLELYSLYKISITLSLTFDFKKIMKSFKELFKNKFSVQQFSIMLLDESFENLKINTSFGIPNIAASKACYKFGENIFGEAVEFGHHIYVPNMSEQLNYSFHPGAGNGTGSFLAIPLIPEENRPIGVLNLQRKVANGFSHSEVFLLKKIAQQIAKVIEKTLLFQQTKELSITDELTKAYNRRYFNQRFEREVLRSLRYRRSLTVVMLDIDNFKNYNDTNGHLMGDEVIKKVAHTLDSIIRKADVLARYGGEEFVLILPEITKQRGIQAAEKVRQVIEKTHFENEDTQPGGKLTVSLGLATLPDDATDANTLLELADKALYKAKNNGRNQAISYSPIDTFDAPHEFHQLELNNQAHIENFNETNYVMATA